MIGTPWSPSPAAVAAASRASPDYDDAPPYDNGAGCAGGCFSSVREAGVELRAMFPGITDAQCYNCRPNTADGNATSIHGAGRALDLMVPDEATGTPVAEYLATHAEAIGVQYFIWRRTYFSRAGSGGHFGAYTGPDDHDAHLHVEWDLHGARLPLPPVSSGWTLPGVLAGLGLVGATWWFLTRKRTR